MRAAGSTVPPRLIILIFASLLGVAAIAAPVHASKEDPHRIANGYLRASEAGAALDADLMRGGGTDDTAVLQALLDRAADGRRIHLYIEGVALVSGLNVYGNTTVECASGGGLYLKDGSSRSIIRNAHRSRDEIVDEHISIRGCFLNGNRFNNPGARPEREPYGNNQEADGSFITGLEFLGVNDLIVENMVIWNVRAFGALIGNASRVDVRGVNIDNGATGDMDWEYLQTDGFHFKGPLRYVTMDGLKLRTGDDALAFNADDGLGDDLTVNNEFGPYVRSGPIEDVTVSNVQLMDSLWGVRILSRKQRIDRIMINNVIGTINGPRLTIISNYMGPGEGNIGAIEFNNVSVDFSRDAKFVSRFLNDHLKVKGSQRHKAAYEENNGGLPTLFNINARVESLSLHNIRTKAIDERPLIRLGPNARIQQMTVALRVWDPDLRAVPLQLGEAARVERLSFELDWNSGQNGLGKDPITRLGGSIGELRWVDTPPRYVDARLAARDSILVRFNQEVKASDYAAGARIEINGVAVRISSAYRDPAGTDSVYYQTERSIGSKDKVSWAYDGAHGMIRNMNGDDLLTVPVKIVAPERGMAAEMASRP